MRALLVLMMLLMLAALMVMHRNYFVEHQQAPLLDKVRVALADSAFDNVDREGLSMNHMDVSLQGFVATPELREEARKKVDAVHGVRCLDRDNHLRIPAHLAASMKDETLALSGWLPNANALHEVTQWLTNSRPGLSVDTKEVKLSVWTTQPEGEPTATPLPSFYQEAWNAIRVKPGLKVENQDGVLAVSGTVPAPALRDAIVQALAGDPATRVTVKAEDLKTGPYIKGAQFLQPEVLPVFLKEFFAAPGSQSFTADGEGVEVHGFATPEMEARWHDLLKPLADPLRIKADLKVFPTRFHFPDYVPESKVPSEAMQPLRAALGESIFHFDSNHFYLQVTEVPKLNAAAQAITAAGKEAKIIIGGYTEADGDPKAQQQAAVKRCETIIAEFKDRGLTSAQFEMTIYGPGAVPMGEDNHRVVELLLK